MKQNRKGFTLIELLIVVVIVGILALAAIPLITSNTRDARRSEGEQMMGSMKGQARVAYAKRGIAPKTLTGAVESDGSGVNAAELVGQYWNVTNNITNTGNLPTDTGTIAVTSKGTDKAGNHTFQWGGGSGSFSWDNS